MQFPERVVLDNETIYMYQSPELGSWFIYGASKSLCCLAVRMNYAIHDHECALSGCLDESHWISDNNQDY